MKAEITMQQVWANPSVMRFFFRSQAERQLKELLESVDESTGAVFNAIENYTDCLDEAEEMLYGDSTEDIIEMLGLTPIESEDDEDDEDEDYATDDDC